MKQSKLLLAALKDVREDFEENKESIRGGNPSQFIEPGLGLCSAVGAATSYNCCTNVLYPYFKTWPHYSGYVHFPVGNGSEDYYERVNLWVGDIGELRLNLLDHMISEVEKEI